MVSIALAFLGGILAAPHMPMLIAGFVALGIATTRSVSARRRAAIASAFAFGLLDTSLRTDQTFVADLHMITLHAVIEDARVVDDSTFTYVARVDDGRSASFTLREPPLSIGERLTVRAKREPFDHARNDAEPAQRDIEAERGIAFLLEHVRVIERAPPDVWDASLWLPRARAWGSQRIHALLGEPDATILAGAMWGERGALPPDLRAEFQDTGTVHVLVTAGLHLGVIAALALGMFSLLRMGRISSSLATIPVVWLYASLSGAHLPSMRAATMLTFALVARASGRDALSWNGLALAAIVVAAIRPDSVASLSFALSFSCVAAIFVFARPITTFLEERGTHHTLAGLIGVALATQCGTWPLTAFGFLVIAPYAPLANAAVVPIVGIAMLTGFAAIAASPVPALAHAMANIAIVLVDWIAGVVRFVAQIPGAHISATPPPIWTIVLYDVSLGALSFALAKRRYVLVAFGVTCAATALCLWPPRPHESDLIITAIDVGQADSILIQTPSGHAYLVDGGGRLESRSTRNGDDTAELVGERVVVPYLIRHGIHHLDAVLLTHGHGDHAGGLPAVLRTLGADGFADSGQSYAGHAYHDALDVAHEKSIPMLEPRAGDVWTIDDGVTLQFYGPSLPYISGGRNDLNDNSLVFRLVYGSFRMLFTGDAGEAAEQRLLASGADLQANVLKVGHHGSAYSTTAAFVKAIHPTIAIISVGRHNLFGHPAPSTLQTLSDANARVYRTDENGAIVIHTNGSHIEARPFLAQSS